MATFYKLFPADWFSGFHFPMIEDLINQAPFISCLQGLGLEWSIEPVVRGWSDQTSSTATSRELAILDTDLQCAAYMHARAQCSLVSWRARAPKACYVN